jgi:hypothetical protein
MEFRFLFFKGRKFNEYSAIKDIISIYQTHYRNKKIYIFYLTKLYSKNTNIAMRHKTANFLDIRAQPAHPVRTPLTNWNENVNQ